MLRKANIKDSATIDLKRFSLVFADAAFSGALLVFQTGLNTPCNKATIPIP